MLERQLIFDCIDLFSGNKKSKFYEKIFDTIDLSCIPEHPQSIRGPKGYLMHALFRAFIIMKCEKQRHITQLVDFLDNNRYLAYLCGFDVFKALPSYSVFQRFIRNIDNNQIKNLMKKQVLSLNKLGFIENSFISLDATPVFANTKHNNPKSFSKNKFKKDNLPKSDRDCALGVHTASNSHNEKKYEFYWGYKNHVLVDAVSGLPIFEVTKPANITDSGVTIPLLKDVHGWFSLKETDFIADKGYDTKAIYNFVHDELQGHAFIPLNLRGTKKKNQLTAGNIICDAGLAMHKDGRQYYPDRIKQKFNMSFKK
ncbi:transposase [Peptoclostridium litorale]|uniref:Transposase IS4 family protein n=1 Tax=Peptoclostridium litorale DSM 5388 TaxID=1121324 RepID=A0A069RNS1_PEPLI|nr:transposase [Peptoclostridium litorale]KDR95832.1 transposase IS4 family protein [Peptoclostridium litorale DSM 5388]